jgi:hypothetical protein
MNGEEQGMNLFGKTDEFSHDVKCLLKYTHKTISDIDLTSQIIS